MIIDIHGHDTPAPKALAARRSRRVAGLADPALKPAVSGLRSCVAELDRCVRDYVYDMRERLAKAGLRDTGRPAFDPPQQETA